MAETTPKKHDGLPVLGYQPQSSHNVAMVNDHKIEEEYLLRRLDALKQDPAIDPRWLAIARTHFEEGFMALNRSVFKPGRITVPGD